MDYDMLKEELLRLKKENEALTKENSDLKKDKLTKMYNVSYWHQQEVSIAEKIIDNMFKGKTSTILFCDLNHLKRVNDLKGHAEANIGIAEIANIIQDCLRTRRSNPDENDMIYPVENVDEDIAVRVGGDEFIIVLSNCNKENANIVVKRIKDRVEKEETKGLSIAIGLTDTNELKDISSRLTADNNYNLLQQLIKKAEANMYSDKIAANSNLPYQERVEILVDYILRGGKNIGLDIGDKALLDQMLKDALVIIQEMINEMGKEKALD